MKKNYIGEGMTTIHSVRSWSAENAAESGDWEVPLDRHAKPARPKNNETDRPSIKSQAKQYVIPTKTKLRKGNTGRKKEQKSFIMRGDPVLVLDKSSGLGGQKAIFMETTIHGKYVVKLGNRRYQVLKIAPLE